MAISATPAGVEVGVGVGGNSLFSQYFLRNNRPLEKVGTLPVLFITESSQLDTLKKYLLGRLGGSVG